MGNAKGLSWRHRDWDEANSAINSSVIRLIRVSHWSTSRFSMPTPMVPPRELRFGKRDVPLPIHVSHWLTSRFSMLTPMVPPYVEEVVLPNHSEFGQPSHVQQHLS
jgi:hypothetical protein